MAPLLEWAAATRRWLLPRPLAPPPALASAAAGCSSSGRGPGARLLLLPAGSSIVSTAARLLLPAGSSIVSRCEGQTLQMSAWIVS